MTTTETFDAFEQRLVAALGAEAETVVEPADGLDRIRGRVARRRRTRRATWLGAAAALVLVAGTVGVLLRSTSNDSAPYVDDRPMIPAPEQPLWLGPPDPDDVSMPMREAGRNLSWAHIMFDPAKGPAEAWFLVVEVARMPLDDGSGSWTPTMINGKTALIGERGGHATVRWELADGWIASAAGNGPDPEPGDADFDDALSAVRSMAESLEPRNPAYWLPVIDRSLRNGDPESTDGYRLGLRGESGRTFVTSVDGVQAYSTLVVAGQPTDAFQLRVSKILADGPPAIPGDQTVVRGRPGRYSEYSDQMGRARRLLSWSEGPYEYRLLLGPDVALDDALRLTERLAPLDDGGWAAAVFPERIPADLGLDGGARTAFPELAYQVPGEVTDGASGSGPSVATTVSVSGS